MRSRLFILLACAACTGWASAAEAASPVKSSVAPQVGVDVASVQTRRDFLFQRMIAKPDDLDAAFEYAALSVQVGDLEAAVSTLERMLIFAPGLPRLQLELGVLYYRLQAYETARTYFEAAVSGPQVPDEVRQKVDQYLTGIDDASQTNIFAGQVRAGIRYQTNANRAPTGSTIVLNGIPFGIDPGARGGEDGNVYAAGAFHLTHKLESQGDTIEADLVTYGAKQFSHQELDLGVAELTVGPAFDLRRFGIENAAIGVYGIVSGVYLGGHFYSGAAGAGTRLVTQPAPGLSLLTALEYRYRDYHESGVAPTADLRDGSEVRGYGTATYIVNPMMTLSANAYAQHDFAQRDFLEYTEAGLSVGPSFTLPAPCGDNAAPWIFSPSVGFVYRDYDGADPVINVDEAERDWETFVGADLTVPLPQRWALLTETEFRHSDSNYTTRDFDNFSVTLSIVKSF